MPSDSTVQGDADETTEDSRDTGAGEDPEVLADIATPEDGRGENDFVELSTAIDTAPSSLDAPEPKDVQDAISFVLDCDVYCALMADVCDEDNAQYANAAGCKAACATFSLGPPSDATGNSLTCRYGRALMAEQTLGDPTTLCVEAGPTGGDACGSVCAGFCTIAQELCISTWVGLDCEGVCDNFPEGSTSCRVDAAIAGDCSSTTPSQGGACEAPVPSGDNCGNAFTVSSLPFTGSGDTTDATDDYHYSLGLCGGEFGGSGGKGAKDQVWSYTASSPETLRIELRAKGDYDSILYVTSGCEDVSAECLDKKDSVGFQPAEIIELGVSAGQTLYFVVDASGPSAADAGSYEVKVSSL